VQVESESEALQRLGVEVPAQPSAREVLHRHLCDVGIPSNIREERLKRVLELQATYIRRKVRRALGTDSRIGTVVCIVPAHCSGFQARATGATAIRSDYQAYVQWGGRRHSIPVALCLVELVA